MVFKRNALVCTGSTVNRLSENQTESQELFIIWFYFTGNAIGEDGIEEVKGWLESNGRLDALGSLSDDEGEVDDDEDEEGDEELGGGDSDDGEAGDQLNLSVTGVSLKPESPLLGTDEEIEKELIKVGLEFKVSSNHCLGNCCFTL